VYAGHAIGQHAHPAGRTSVVQYGSELDDLEVGGSLSLLQIASKMDGVEGRSGSSMTFEPTQEASCEWSVYQGGTAG